MGLWAARPATTMMLKVIYMQERLIFGENQEPLALSPVYQAHTTTTLGDLELDYMNARLRHFPGNPDMNHLEYTGPDGRLYGIFFGQLDEDAPEELAELGFPATVDPLPSAADVRWYDQAVMERMNVEIAEPVVEVVTVPGSDPNKDTASLVAMGAAALLVAFAADKLLGNSNNSKRD
jgi:hypothetical protein